MSQFRKLSVVVPCYNEKGNIAPLVEQLEAALPDIAWEVLFVDDDSPDETWRVAQELGHDLENVHVIRRVGRRGLSSAVTCC